MAGGPNWSASASSCSKFGPGKKSPRGSSNSPGPGTAPRAITPGLNRAKRTASVDTDEITRILNSPETQPEAIEKVLLPAVYEELRRLARHKMAAESSDHTLQPTALVHEAWLRMVSPGQ